MLESPINTHHTIKPGMWPKLGSYVHHTITFNFSRTYLTNGLHVISKPHHTLTLSHTQGPMRSINASLSLRAPLLVGLPSGLPSQAHVPARHPT